MSRAPARAALAGHLPRKRFGQNFLVDQQVIASIVALIGPQPDDLLLEIGPGLGAMTEQLLPRLKQLQVVEIDRDLAARLRQQHDASRLLVHEADALQFDFAALAQQAGRALRVVGNLPYNISTPLLFRIAALLTPQLATDAANRTPDRTPDRASKLAPALPLLQDAHFMLQREVVDRMTAPPGGKDYGRLSVMLQARFAMRRVLDVPPEAFHPVPAVNSAIVRMQPLPQPLVTAALQPRFEQVVAAAFSQRRKTLRNALRALISPERLQALDIDPGLRAETLPVEAFRRIAEKIT
jgi:16S rRNA (adenine1518-N6/adenine1519-N6)-dimethyltransferase